MMWGTLGGYRFMGGDYFYAEKERSALGGVNEGDPDFSFVSFSPSFLLRNLVVREEMVGDRIASAVGHGDINFESAEFSEKFFVSCDDRRWAYDAINYQTMELLLANPAVYLECTPSMLVVLVPIRWDVPQFERFSNLGIEFLNSIPEHARMAIY